MSHTNQKINESKLEKLKIEHQKTQLKANLSSLPKPKNEYQTDLPEMEEEIDSNNEIMDAEEELKKKKKEAELEQERRIKMRFLNFN